YDARPAHGGAQEVRPEEGPQALPVQQALIHPRAAMPWKSDCGSAPGWRSAIVVLAGSWFPIERPGCAEPRFVAVGRASSRRRPLSADTTDQLSCSLDHSGLRTLMTHQRFEITHTSRSLVCAPATAGVSERR